MANTFNYISFQEWNLMFHRLIYEGQWDYIASLFNTLFGSERSKEALRKKFFSVSRLHIPGFGNNIDASVQNQLLCDHLYIDFDSVRFFRLSDGIIVPIDLSQGSSHFFQTISKPLLLKNLHVYNLKGVMYKVHEGEWETITSLDDVRRLQTECYLNDIPTELIGLTKAKYCTRIEKDRACSNCSETEIINTEIINTEIINTEIFNTEIIDYCSGCDDNYDNCTYCTDDGGYDAADTIDTEITANDTEINRTCSCCDDNYDTCTDSSDDCSYDPKVAETNTRINDTKTNVTEIDVNDDSAPIEMDCACGYCDDNYDTCTDSSDNGGYDFEAIRTNTETNDTETNANDTETNDTERVELNVSVLLYMVLKDSDVNRPVRPGSMMTGTRRPSESGQKERAGTPHVDPGSPRQISMGNEIRK
ncbi:hypothetical protein K440DRAFT_642169 [Wilcoxina mikolae CBS 423.85]|nr:hypothetical protein K440DRAFT_642169 [Wilcoxina mikolae CBS 423.85]